MEAHNKVDMVCRSKHHNAQCKDGEQKRTKDHYRNKCRNNKHQYKQLVLIQQLVGWRLQLALVILADKAKDHQLENKHRGDMLIQTQGDHQQISGEDQLEDQNHHRNKHRHKQEHLIEGNKCSAHHHGNNHHLRMVVLEQDLLDLHRNQ